MSAQMQENDTDQEQTPEVTAEDKELRKQAIDAGWNPDKSKHHGKSDWVDYKDYLERGEHFLPIVRAERDKLRKELLTRDGKIATLETAVKEAVASIKAFQKIHDEDTAQRVKEAEKSLKSQILEAKRSGDVEAEWKLLEALETLKEDKAAAERKAPEQESTPTPKQPADEPWAQEWFSDHPWFGKQGIDDIDRTAHMQRVGARLKRANSPLTGKDFMDECLRIVDEERQEEAEAEAEGRPVRRGSKVEASSNPGRQPSKRPFDNLPSDVKKYCNEEAAEKVGKGKRYEKLSDWQDAFASAYIP